MRRQAFLSAAIVLSIAAFSSCRTTRPAGNESPLLPIAAASREAVIPELKRQMAAVHAVRSLMRIRATTAGKTQSFRAQLLVEPATNRMELTAYTPVGTEAMSIAADGDRVTFLDHMNRTAWQGSSAELARSIGFFDPSTPLASWALDLFGYPARGEFIAGDGGLASGVVGDMHVTFDPPLFPARGVVVTRGADKLEVTHLEQASTDASVAIPAIPRGYTCCVVPQM